MKPYKKFILALLLVPAFFCVSVGASEIISKTGGRAVLKSTILGPIELTFPSGCFPQPQAIQVQVTQSKDTEDDFKSSLLAPTERFKRLPGEVRIHTGKSKPRSTVKVKITLPPGKVKAPDAMAELFYSSSIEVHDSFDMVDSRWNAQTRELSFDLTPEYFTSERRDDDVMEAVIVIVQDQEKK